MEPRRRYSLSSGLQDIARDMSNTAGAARGERAVKPKKKSQLSDAEREVRASMRRPQTVDIPSTAEAIHSLNIEQRVEEARQAMVTKFVCNRRLLCQYSPMCSIYLQLEKQALLSEIEGVESRIKGTMKRLESHDDGDSDEELAMKVDEALRDAGIRGNNGTGTEEDGTPELIARSKAELWNMLQVRLCWLCFTGLSVICFDLGSPE